MRTEWGFQEKHVGGSSPSGPNIHATTKCSSEYKRRIRPAQRVETTRKGPGVCDGYIRTIPKLDRGFWENTLLDWGSMKRYTQKENERGFLINLTTVLPLLGYCGEPDSALSGRRNPYLPKPPGWQLSHIITLHGFPYIDKQSYEVERHDRITSCLYHRYTRWTIRHISWFRSC